MNFLVLFLLLASSVKAEDYDLAREDRKWRQTTRCLFPSNIPSNLVVRQQGKGRTLRYMCSSNSLLIGKRFSTCLRGRWSSPPPICIAKGCTPHVPPANGRLTQMYDGAMYTFGCNPGYVQNGSTTLYCDGFQWNATAPYCIAPTINPKVFCDFEDPGLCGWSHDITHDFAWIRNLGNTPSAHAKTGPSFDHTLGKDLGGHYMYLEASSPRKEGDVARLISPVYPTVLSGSCFTFWYHMYGETTGTLRVYLKGENQVLAELNPLWSMQGEQGDQWLQGQANIQPMTTTFQIIMEGVRASDFMGDIAIDDVRLSPGPCSVQTNQSLQASCRSFGCYGQETEGLGCSCSLGCQRFNSCCSDYWTVCIRGNTTGNTSLAGRPTETSNQTITTINIINPTEKTTRLPEVTARLPELTTRLLELTTGLPELTTGLPELTTRLPELTTVQNQVTTSPITGSSKVPPQVTFTKVIANVTTTRIYTPTNSNKPSSTTTQRTTAIPTITTQTNVLTGQDKLSTPIPTTTSRDCVIDPSKTSLNTNGDYIASFKCANKTEISQDTTSYTSSNTFQETTENPILSTSSVSTNIATKSGMKVWIGTKPIVTPSQTPTMTTTTVTETTMYTTQSPPTSIRPTTYQLTLRPNRTSLFATTPTQPATTVTEAFTTLTSEITKIQTTSVPITTSKSTIQIDKSIEMATTRAEIQTESVRAVKTSTEVTKTTTQNLPQTKSAFMFFTRSTVDTSSKSYSKSTTSTSFPNTGTDVDSYFTNLVVDDDNSDEDMSQNDDNGVSLTQESVDRWIEFPRRSHPLSPKSSSAYITATAVGCILAVAVVSVSVYVVHYVLRRRRLMHRSLRDDSEMRFISENEEIEISLAEHSDSVKLM